MEVVGLPQFVVLQSGCPQKYLQLVREESDRLHGYVRFSQENVASPEAKFQVENSKSGNGLVHIRSCYNNKYLVLKGQSEDEHWIVAKAEKQEEDRSKWSCTLFKPTSVDGDPKRIRLTHLHLQNNLQVELDLPEVMGIPHSHKGGCVSVKPSAPDPLSIASVFHVIDWGSLVILPKYVDFKGDNGKYLRAHWQGDHQYLQFSLGDIGADPKAAGNEIIPNPDGTIRIKSVYWDTFWRLSPCWIWADSRNSTANDKNTVFEAVKCNDNSIALRNLGNNKFCARLTADFKESCLNANTDNINQWAKLEVSEHVVSRKISNVNYRLMDARIYGENILVLSSSVMTNDSHSPNEENASLIHTESRTSTWNRSVSLKLGIKATFEVGLPKIFEGKIEVSGEIAGQYAWGDTNTTTETLTTNYKVVVPPMKKVTVRMLATQGAFDIPFFYTQRDVLYDGLTVSTEAGDGVYTGANCYSFHIQTKEEPLGSIKLL